MIRDEIIHLMVDAFNNGCRRIFHMMRFMDKLLQQSVWLHNNSSWIVHDFVRAWDVWVKYPTLPEGSDDKHLASILLHGFPTCKQSPCIGQIFSIHQGELKAIPRNRYHCEAATASSWFIRAIASASWHHCSHLRCLWFLGLCGLAGLHVPQVQCPWEIWSGAECLVDGLVGCLRKDDHGPSIFVYIDIY